MPEALAGYEAAEGITVMMRCTGIQWIESERRAQCKTPTRSNKQL